MPKEKIGKRWKFLRDGLKSVDGELHMRLTREEPTQTTLL